MSFHSLSWTKLKMKDITLFPFSWDVDQEMGGKYFLSKKSESINGIFYATQLSKIKVFESCIFMWKCLQTVSESTYFLPIQKCTTISISLSFSSWHWIVWVVLVPLPCDYSLPFLLPMDDVMLDLLLAFSLAQSVTIFVQNPAIIFSVILSFDSNIDFNNGGICFYLQTRWTSRLRWTTWPFTNKCTRGEAVNQNWLSLATGSKMEDELVILQILLKKKLELRLYMLHYLSFIASRYKTGISCYFSLK